MTTELLCFRRLRTSPNCLCFMGPVWGPPPLPITRGGRFITSRWDPFVGPSSVPWSLARSLVLHADLVFSSGIDPVSLRLARSGGEGSYRFSRREFVLTLLSGCVRCPLLRPERGRDRGFPRCSAHSTSNPMIYSFNMFLFRGLVFACSIQLVLHSYSFPPLLRKVYILV